MGFFIVRRSIYDRKKGRFYHLKKQGKKILALILCSAVSMSILGCGGGKQAQPETAATLEQPATVSEQDASKDQPEAEEAEAINLYFVRHGKTILNTLNRVQGWSDSPLTAAGADVAKDTAYGMADIVFDLAYASDRMRAIETARMILDANPAGSDLDIVKLQGLRECNYGKYEGELNAVMWGDIMNSLGVKNAEELLQLEEANRKIYDTVAALDETGEAESYDEVLTRLMDAVDVIVKNAENQKAKNVLIVAHGGAIGAILSQLNGAAVGELGNASVSLVKYSNGDFKVVSVGDMSYCENGRIVRQNMPEAANEVMVYLVRHGETIFNAMGRTQGWVDSPLTAAGAEAAGNLGKGLADVKFAGVYSSDLGRAVETAQIVLELNQAGDGMVPVQNPGLRETYYGKFESGINADMLNAALEELGLSGMEDLNALDNGIAVVTDALHILDESGEAETYEMMSQRVRAALDKICEETAAKGGGNILVVAHGNAIMSVLNSIGDANVLDIENASVSKLIYRNGSYTIESLNDTGYAEAGAAR